MSLSTEIRAMLTQKNIYKQTMTDLGWYSFSKFIGFSQITVIGMLHSPSFSASDKPIPLYPVSTGIAILSLRSMQLKGALQYH